MKCIDVKLIFVTCAAHLISVGVKYLYVCLATLNTKKHSNQNLIKGKVFTGVPHIQVSITKPAEK